MSRSELRPGEIHSLEELEPGMVVEWIHPKYSQDICRPDHGDQELIGILAVGKAYDRFSPFNRPLRNDPDQYWLENAYQSLRKDHDMRVDPNWVIVARYYEVGSDIIVPDDVPITSLGFPNTTWGFPPRSEYYLRHPQVKA